MFHVFQILMPWADASRAAFRLVRDFIHKIVEDAPAVIDTARLAPADRHHAAEAAPVGESGNAHGDGKAGT
jgi:hypothetical protein